jgi:hypothetical protein
MAKPRIDLNALNEGRNTENPLFSSPPPQNAPVVQTPKVALIEVKEATKVKDMQTTIYVSEEDYAIVKGYVVMRRGSDSPFFTLRDAFSEYAQMLKEQHGSLKPFYGKMKK